MGSRDLFLPRGINNILRTSDTDAPENSDTWLAASLFYKRYDPLVKIRIFLVDFRHAYKTVPLCRQQGDFAHIVLAPPEGDPVVAELRTQPFGSRRAPANWGRVTSFVQWVLATFFCLYLAKNADDCFATEPESTCFSAFSTVREVCALLGFALEGDKENAPSPSIDILGATVSLGSFFLEACLPTGRKRLLVVYLKQVLPKGVLTPGEAPKLRGRLGYAQSLMFGRLGRARLQPFSDRQYSKLRHGSWELSSDLREVLAWRIANLETSAPRRVNFGKEAPVLLYADASGEGHVAAVLWADGRKISYSAHLPAWTSSWCIFEFELVAPTLGIVADLIHAPSRNIFAFCDYAAADHAVIRGSNPTRLG